MPVSSPIVIPADKLEKMIGRSVHVLGWNRAEVFKYQGTINGFHQLRTPRRNKLYTVRGDLTYTNNAVPTPTVKTGGADGAA